MSYLDQPDDLSSRASRLHARYTRMSCIINGNRWLAFNRHEKKTTSVSSKSSSTKNETRILRKRSRNSHIISSLSRGSFRVKSPLDWRYIRTRYTRKRQIFMIEPRVHLPSSSSIPSPLFASLFYFTHFQSYEIRIVQRRNLVSKLGNNFARRCKREFHFRAFHLNFCYVVNVLLR